VGLIASMFIGNVMLLVMNIPMVGLFARLLYVPNWILVPGIAAISFVGVYAVHATTFDLVLMVALGIFGWGLRKLGFPMARAPGLRARGHDGAEPAPGAVDLRRPRGHLFQSTVSVTLWVLAALVLVAPALVRRLRRKR